VRAINTSLAADSIEKYINNDSTHGVRDFRVIVVDKDTIRVGMGPTTSSYRTIKLLRSRVPEELAWRENGVQILFETTGAFTSTKEMARHDVDYVILSSPPKDLDVTPMFVYGVNDRSYSGEQIISIASCTTNCIAPFLEAANQIGGGIRDGSFITVHAATASQSIVDEAHDKKRTNRSIFNNIIPHTTGASKTVDWLLPDLKGKIKGTSIRVPINNVSMVDMNIHFNEPITVEDFYKQLNESNRYPDVVEVHTGKGVSSDFIGYEASSVIDYHSTFQLTDTGIKFALWYDNEWSYCAQMINMARTVDEVTRSRRVRSIKDTRFAEKNVMVRVDFNCPLNEFGAVADDFRVRAALPTLNHILHQGPKRVVLSTHFGRPKGVDPSHSTQRFAAILSDLIDSPVHFVDSGLEATEADVSCGAKGAIYLLENTRFHDYETKTTEVNSHQTNFKVDVFCNEAFSASHRAHASVTGITAPERCVGFQLLREVHCLDRILGRAGEVTMAIVGGAKVTDKLPMLKHLSHRVDCIAIGGNNVNAITADPTLLDGVTGNRAEIVIMDDGFGNASPSDPPLYGEAGGVHPLYDAGPVSLNKLAAWVNKADIIFWNGALGITEHPFYKNGSEQLVHMLGTCPGDVIIGGGDTAGFVQGASGFDFTKKYDFYHISTGGGASIQYLESESLPGIFHYESGKRVRGQSIVEEFRQLALKGGTKDK